MNPLLSGLPQNPQMQQLKSIFQSIQKMPNPMGYLQTMLSQNPKVDEIMTAIRNNNGNLEKAYYELANKKGVNPNDYIMR